MNAKKVIGISLLATGIGTAIYYLVARGRDIGIAEKQGRYLSFSTSYCMAGLNGSVQIDLPAISDAFYEDFDVPQNVEKMNQIRSQYGVIVSSIASLTNLPESLIYSFIFIESAGNAFAMNGKAIGLMQVSTTSATDIVYMEYKKGRLGSGESAILRNYLGARLDQILSMRSPGVLQVVTQTDLYEPELNILIGSILLGQLIDEHTENDVLRLDKVVVRYNVGYYSFGRGKNLIGDVLTVIGQVNPFTSSYITKLIGRNGVLEMIESENCA
jgi:hypothetical protein